MSKAIRKNLSNAGYSLLEPNSARAVLLNRTVPAYTRRDSRRDSGRHHTTTGIRVKRTNSVNSPNNGTLSATEDEGESLEEYLASRGHNRTCLAQLVFIPDHGKQQFHWVELWDLFITILLLITSYYVPWEVAFLSHDPFWLYEVNRFLDLSFTMDIILQFFIAFPNHCENLSMELWEVDPVKIAKRYCAFPLTENGRAGWFWIDLLSVMPGWIDGIATVYRHRHHSNRHTKILTLLRAIRLVRMLRLTRLLRLMDRWHAFFGFPFFWIEIIKFVLITTMTVHWMACAWAMIEGKVLKGLISYETDGNTWLSVLIETKGDPCTPDSSSNPGCVYVLALYWAMMTLTTVGYGDISPQNSFEYLVCTIFMLIAGFVWAYVVGCIVALLSNLDPIGVKWKQQMDDLNEMMDNRNLPLDLQVRLRNYMNESKHMIRLKGQRHLMEECMSEALQRDVCRATAHSDLLKNVFWAKDLEEDALLNIIKDLEHGFFGPNEILHVHKTMLIICKGIMACSGKVYTRGQAWGVEEVLLESTHLTKAAMPRTMSYVDVMMLSKENLGNICRTFPKADKRLRRAQIRTAVWRAFCVTAFHMKSGGGSEKIQDKFSVSSLPRQRTFYSMASSASLEPSNPAMHLKTDMQEELRQVEDRLMRRQDEMILQMKVLTSEVRTLAGRH